MFFVLWGRERVRDVVEGRVEFVVVGLPGCVCFPFRMPFTRNFRQFGRP